MKSIVIAGAAGDGINTIAAALEKILMKTGYELFAYRNYMSRVRGGYNYTTIVFDRKPVRSIVEHADFLIALNREAVMNAEAHLNPDGLLIAFDEILNTLESPAWHSVAAIDLAELKTRTTDKNAQMMALPGFVIAQLAINDGYLKYGSEPKWSESVREANRAALWYGYKQGFVDIEALPDVMPFADPENTRDRLLINGNQAIALGALAAGVSFYCAYPMAPSTSIMSYLASKEREMKIVVEQAEDEIAAIIAAIGASATGVRAMTGTSGGGFSLMVEGLGFAAVAEVPLVVANVQRPGPATGLPTRTEQADFSFVAYASQGEFARIVLAPTDAADCFETTFRAFNLAEKFQVPVILLSDQLLADSDQTVAKFDTSHLVIERHLDYAENPDYKRYPFDQVSGGRKYPGIDPSTLIMTDSHTHTETGYITEDIEDTVKLKKKFLARIEAISRELRKPKLFLRGGVEYLGIDIPENIRQVLVTWGSSTGAAIDSLEQLDYTAVLAFSDLMPLPSDILSTYQEAQAGPRQIKLYSLEANATGQFANYLKIVTDVRFDGKIEKYDGRPFTADFIAEAVQTLRKEAK
ncbi:MAG: 2-oxoacid:acceptor oxidoreductase subunit alpha [Bacillota bacterium]|nr:2-oxoacid:acceptor oxidoreductase subunit alpha [Bacillota bacterium]